jgi:hypothetical protein
MLSCLFLDTDDRRFFSLEARRVIHEVCEATEHEVRALLPGLPEVIELAAQTGTFVIPETGELGTAWSPRRVNWTVDPTRTGGVAAIARTELRATLFHELHHLARGWTVRGGTPRAHFVDGVISEGLATAFERDFGGRRPPWGDYPPEAAAWVTELLALPLAASYQQWMFQHPDGRRWIGYRAGTYLADRAIAASGRSAAQLARTSAREILQLSGLSLPAY